MNDRLNYTKLIKRRGRNLRRQEEVKNELNTKKINVEVNEDQEKIIDTPTTELLLNSEIELCDVSKNMDSVKLKNKLAYLNELNNFE